MFLCKQFFKAKMNLLRIPILFCQLFCLLLSIASLTARAQIECLVGCVEDIIVEEFCEENCQNKGDHNCEPPNDKAPHCCRPPPRSQGCCGTARDGPCCGNGDDGHCYRGKLQLPVANGTEREAQQLNEMLTDGLSIIEIYAIEREEKWRGSSIFHYRNAAIQPSICNTTKSSSTYTKIQKGISKVLKFYESHMNFISANRDEYMSFLKAVDDKYGRRFQIEYPINDWMTTICNKNALQKNYFCNNINNNWKQREGRIWKSADVLNSITASWELVGHEQEQLWGKLNGQCQKALVNRCSVPLICERTLYDPTPRSQYYLSHQVLQRILTEQSNCPDAKRLLSEEVNDQLCSKMYQEAQLVAQMGYPHSLRDIFLEYVAFCGYMRYPNFFREDWIENILSWQSRSDYGCFTHGNDYKRKFWTGDKAVKRRSTLEEKEKGIAEDEECLPHLTTIGLAALSMSWEFMEDNCK